MSVANVEELEVLIHEEHLSVVLQPAEGGRAANILREQNEGETVTVAKVIYSRGFFRVYQRREGDEDIQVEEFAYVMANETPYRFSRPFRVNHGNMMSSPLIWDGQPLDQIDMVRRMLSSHLDDKGEPKPGVAVKEAIVDLNSGLVAVFETPIPSTQSGRRHVLVLVRLFIPQWLSREEEAKQLRVKARLADRQLSQGEDDAYRKYREVVS